VTESSSKRRFAMVLCALALSACGGSTVGQVTDITSGEDLFMARVLGNRAGCVTCHSLESGTRLAGPSLAGIGEVAASRVEGMSATEYLRQSIVEPNAFLVDGFRKDTMPTDYVLSLTDAQVDALVEYMEGL